MGNQEHVHKLGYRTNQDIQKSHLNLERLTGHPIKFIIIERLERDIISTRTNIQSLLGDHEYHGHYKKNWKHKKNSFDPTYHYQTRTMKSRFMKTTHKFREYVKSVVKQKEYGL